MNASTQNTNNNNNNNNNDNVNSMLNFIHLTVFVLLGFKFLNERYSQIFYQLDRFCEDYKLGLIF